ELPVLRDLERQCAPRGDRDPVVEERHVGFGGRERGEARADGQHRAEIAVVHGRLEVAARRGDGAGVEGVRRRDRREGEGRAGREGEEVRRLHEDSPFEAGGAPPDGEAGRVITTRVPPPGGASISSACGGPATRRRSRTEWRPKPAPEPPSPRGAS